MTAVVRDFRKTQFGDMPKRYRIEPLTDYVFFQEGPGLRKWQWTDDGMKVINGRNLLLNGQIDLGNTDRFISQIEFDDKYRHFAIEPGDIVVTSSGTIGKVARIREEHLPLMMNTSVIRFHPHDPSTLDLGFLFAFLRSSLFQQQAQSFAIGAAQLNFGPIHLKQMKIVVPPLGEQRNIASIISAYDDLIENNGRRIQLLEQAARLLYKEWFVHLRFPGHEHIKITNGVPEGWAVRRLSDLATKIGSGATPRGGANAYHSKGITLIRSMNIYDYQFEDDGLAYINDDQADKLSAVSVEPLDILLNITGASVARCCIVPDRHLPARVNQHVMIIRLNPTECGPHYVLHTINSHQHKEKLLSIARAGGATREALTKDVIQNLSLLVPSKHLLDQFEETAGSLFDQRQLLAAQNSQLAQARDLLLPRLMSGEVAA